MTVGKKKNVVIAFIVSVLLAIVGFFCIGTNRQTTSADETTTSTDTAKFELIDGLSVEKNSTYGYMNTRVRVTLSQEIYDKLDCGNFVSADGTKYWGYSYKYTSDNEVYEMTDYVLYVGYYKDEIGDSFTYQRYELDTTKSFHSMDVKQIEFIAEGDKDYIEGQPYTFFAKDFPVFPNMVGETETGEVIYSYDYDVLFRAYLVKETKAVETFDFFGRYREDIGGLDWTYSELKEKEASGGCDRHILTLAQTILTNESNLSESMIAYLNVVVGNDTEGTFPLTLKYKDMTVLGVIEEVQKTYMLPNSMFYQGAENIFKSVQSIENANGNLIYDVSYYDVMVSPYGGDSYVHLVADGYEYIYDEENHTGTLEITYRDYSYEDFKIFVKDNDSSDNIDYVYSISSIYSNLKVLDDGRYSITFDYGYIRYLLQNNFTQHVEIDSDNVFIENGSSIINTDTDIVCDEDGVSITFASENESELSKLFVYVYAEIIPDYMCLVNIEYANLYYDEAQGIICVDTETLTNISMMDSVYNSLLTPTAFANSSYFSYVADGLVIDGLSDIEYYVYSDIDYEEIGTSEEGYPIRTITVLYTYKTLFRLDVGGDISFVPTIENRLMHPYSYFGIEIPEYHRITGISLAEDNEYDAMVSFCANNIEDSYIELLLTNTNEEKIITLNVEYTNTFNVEITYYDQYKATPFATKKR